MEKFSEGSPVCEKKTNWKYELCEYEIGMITFKCVLFKIHRLFCIIMKHSLLLLFLLVNFIFFCFVFLRIELHIIK